MPDGTSNDAGGEASGARRLELAANLAAVRERIAAACAECGRDPDDVTLIAVTKTRPPADVAMLAELGVLDLGENRVNELVPKAQACRDQLRWHFIGQLQTNKAPAVARVADVVHSLDRLRVIDALSRAAERAGRRVGALVQVNLDERTGDRARGGADPAHLSELAAAVAGADALRLLGVMAVAPLGADPAAAFTRLGACAEQLRAEHPQARWISAGMSADLEFAVRAGATHVRVGSGLLGARGHWR